MARAHADDLVGRQDVQHDRLEDRLGVPARPLVTAATTAKQFLTYVNGAPFQPAIAVGLGLPRRVLRRPRRRPRRPSATTSSRGSSPPGSPCTCREATYFIDRRHPPGGARRRRHGVLPVAARAVRRGGDPERGVLRPSEYGRHLVRFACCKRLEVHRRGRRALVEGLRDDRCLRIAAVQHDIVWNDRDANFDTARADDRAAAAGGARPGRC